MKPQYQYKCCLLKDECQGNALRAHIRILAAILYWRPFYIGGHSVNSMWITGTITAKQKVRQKVPGLYAVCRSISVSHVMFLTRSDNNIICKRTVSGF